MKRPLQSQLQSYFKGQKAEPHNALIDTTNS